MSGVVVFDHKCDPPRELDSTPNPKAGDTIFVCECLCRWKAVGWRPIDNGLEFSPVTDVTWEMFIGREVVEKETKTVMVREVLVEPDEFTYPSADLLGDLEARNQVMQATQARRQAFSTTTNTTWWATETMENDYQYERLYTQSEAATRAARRKRNQKEWQKFHPPVQERKRS